MDPISRYEASKKAAKILEQIPPLDPKNIIVEPTHYYQLADLAMVMAEQTPGDPRTFSFLDTQSVDFDHIIRCTKVDENTLNGYIHNANKELLSTPKETLIASRAEFFEKSQQQIWAQHPLHSKMVQQIQEALPSTDDPFYIHLMAHTCAVACQPHFQALGSLLRKVFWEARMKKCAAIGYFSQEVIPDPTNFQALPGLSEALALVRDKQYSLFKVDQNTLKEQDWMEHPLGWNCHVKHSLGGCFSSKYLSNQAVVFRSEGRLFTLSNQAYPTEAYRLILTKSGVLMSEEHVVECNSQTILPDCITTTPKITELVYTEPWLSDDIKSKLEQAISSKRKNLESSFGIGSYNEWVDNHLPFCFELLKLKQKHDSIFEKVDFLLKNKDIEISSFNKHQLELLKNAAKITSHPSTP